MNKPDLVEIVKGTFVEPGDVVHCTQERRARINWVDLKADRAAFDPIKSDGTPHRGISGWSGGLFDRGYMLEVVEPLCLSIRQPWPWAILHARKRIENRDKCSFYRYRGKILLHASSAMTWKEWVFGVKAISTASGRSVFPTYDQFMGSGQLTLTGRQEVQVWGDSLRMGGIVGKAVVVDCILPGGRAVEPVGASHALANDPWYCGSFGLVLDDVVALPFIPCKGALGLWRAPADVLTEAAAALQKAAATCEVRG